MDNERCLTPEEVGFQIAIHGTWLKWITLIIGLGFPTLVLNLGTLIWTLYTRVPLLPDSCIEHIMEVEDIGVHRLDMPCEQQTMLLNRRLGDYLIKVKEVRSDAR